MIQDLRYAIRSLRKAPMFTVIAVLTLALGIGANTAMFSVVYGVLLRPLPYPHPDRVVQLAESFHSGRYGLGVTYPQYRFIQEHATGLEAVAATTSLGFNLFSGEQADRVRGLRVSRDYFRVLGVSPQHGRAFTADEDQPSGANVMIISHGLWARRFGADPAVVGRTAMLDGHTYTIVGVMPAGFQTVPAVDVWSTIAQVGRTIGSGQNLEVLGRMVPGASLAQARARIGALTASYLARFPRQFSADAKLDFQGYQDAVVGGVKEDVGILFGAIAFVLLIACANVANLVLGRTTARAREIAVRTALGAGRGRVARLLLTESVVLALVGGAVGVLLAEWGLRALLAIAPAALPRAGDVHLDGWALGFTFALSIVTGVVFGLLPAWRSARTDVHDTLKEGAGRSTETAGRGRARGALVVAEVALSLVLLVGAGLLIRTFANLRSVNPGFRSDHLLTAEIWITGSRYDSAGSVTGLYRTLTDRLNALPGVRSAAIVEAGLPLERGGNAPIHLDDGGQWYGADYRTVTPGYFATLGAPLLQGRTFTDADRAGGQPVAMVNQSLARNLLGDSGAVGHRVSINGVTRQIVGVVGDVKSHIYQSAPPSVFIPSAQTPPGLTKAFVSWFPIHVVMRTASDPARFGQALVQAIHATDPLIPVGRVRTMNDVLADSLAFQHFTMLLLGIFAALALVLAAVGIYGVMSYLTIQRTHEVGVRLALGALPGDVLRVMLRRGMALVGVGGVLGIAGAVALTRLLQHQLFGVQPRDLGTFSAAAVFLGLVALVACFVPARRAAHGDPVTALRQE